MPVCQYVICGFMALKKGHLHTMCAINKHEHEAYQMVGQAKRHVPKIRPKAVGRGIFNRFFKNSGKYQTEVVADVIYSVADD